MNIYFFESYYPFKSRYTYNNIIKISKKNKKYIYLEFKFKKYIDLFAFNFIK